MSIPKIASLRLEKFLPYTPVPDAQHRWVAAPRNETPLPKLLPVCIRAICPVTTTVRDVPFRHGRHTSWRVSAPAHRCRVTPDALRPCLPGPDLLHAPAPALPAILTPEYDRTFQRLTHITSFHARPSPLAGSSSRLFKSSDSLENAPCRSASALMICRVESAITNPQVSFAGFPASASLK